MYILTGTRLQQVASCSYKKITIDLGKKQYADVNQIIKALKNSGYDIVEQHFNGTNTKNLFFYCESKTKYPLGHKFHEISITAQPN